MIALKPSPSPVTISRAKVAQPRVSGFYMPRPALETRLGRVLTVPLTVIVAPAGHGKTRSLVEWTNHLGCTTAWLTLSARDVDLTRFAAHIAAALDRAVPGLARHLYRQLGAPDRLNPRDLGESFADALYDLHNDLILILDDLHMTDTPAVMEFLAGFVQASPARMHVVASTRRPLSLALSRLRTQGMVEEFTADDLRFTLAETDILLREVLGGDTPPESAARLHAAVGGWPAAIRLLAIGLDAGATLQAPLDLPTGPGATLLLDYLGEEVLSQLTPSQRNLLLLAALPERFNADLLSCMASHINVPFEYADLETLRSLDLFRETPGQDETWFVYHALFSDMFRRQLAVNFGPRMADLHLRCAACLRDAGHTRDAVWHLVQCGDISAATNLVESRIGEAFGREDWQGIASWLMLIPEEQVRNNPALSLASAWVAFLSGRGGRLAAHLTDLASLHSQGLLSDDHLAQVEILRFGTSVTAVHPIRTAADILQNVLPRIDHSHRYRYGFAHSVVGLGLSEEGDTDGALQHLETFTLTESAQIDAASIRGFFGRVLVLWHAGRLTACAQAAADMQTLTRANSLPLTNGWGDLFLSLVAHERGELAAAASGFAAVIARADHLHFWCVREAFVRLIVMFELEGRQEEADRTLTRLREIVVAIAAPEHLPICDSLAARLALFRGDLSAATHWLISTQANPDRFEPLYLENPILTRVIVLLALGQPAHLVEASDILATLRQHTEATFTRLAGQEVKVLTAYLHEVTGDTRAATELMAEALLMGAEEQAFHRLTFLPLPLGPLLRRAIDSANLSPSGRAALEQQAARFFEQTPRAEIRRAASVHALTERELEVLDCLARRLTNDEIGSELFISTITARNHVGHVCSKLGVSGRRAAVTIAREQGLLD